jgi:ferredoxin
LADTARRILVCSCEDTMAPDAAAIARGCKGADVRTARHLCGAESELARRTLGEGAPVTIGCTLMAPLFREFAADAHAPEPTFANIRETAGWAKQGARSGPKMAALLAAAAETMPPTKLVSLESAGVALVLGRDAAALTAAGLLEDFLDLTVVLLPGAEAEPPRVVEYPVLRGRARSATGVLGGFTVTLDAVAAAAPSSRAAFDWGLPRDGTTSRCDLILDLSGAAPLFPPGLREGFLRADPSDPAAVLRLVLEARDLVGTFDRPRFVDFTEALCAHKRSAKLGCTRCLDLCPAGAITPPQGKAGQHVSIDAAVCMGCGGCAAVCPTGAASYALPPVDALIRKLRTLLLTFHDAGGQAPVLLVHEAGEADHGGALIDALARHGDGLPPDVLPLAVHSAAGFPPEAIAAAFAYGARALRVLSPAKPKHPPEALHRTFALMASVLEGLGWADTARRLALIETDDPFTLGEVLAAIPALPAAAPRKFQPLGDKRTVLRFSLRELHAAAPAPKNVLPLPEGAQFGAVHVRADGCTLCHACVGVCPTGALTADADTPLLRFTEDACVQCGLCQATCPEKVITLEPRLDFVHAATPRVLKQEEPFHCTRCQKPFGTASTIARIEAALSGKHWMFAGKTSQLDLVRMCADCRGIEVTTRGTDPYAGPERPRPRTAADYAGDDEDG